MVKFGLEGSLWTLLLGGVISVGILLPIGVGREISLFSAKHIGISVVAGAAWTKAEWCEMTLQKDEI